MLTHKVNFIFLFSLVLIFISCDKEEINIAAYHSLVNQAERLICENEFEKSSELYSVAFKKIRKPFGEDLFNAFLVSYLAND